MGIHGAADLQQGPISIWPPPATAPQEAGEWGTDSPDQWGTLCWGALPRGALPAVHSITEASPAHCTLAGEGEGGVGFSISGIRGPQPALMELPDLFTCQFCKCHLMHCTRSTGSHSRRSITWQHILEPTPRSRHKHNVAPEFLTCSEASRVVLNTGTSGAGGKQRLWWRGLEKQRERERNHVEHRPTFNAAKILTQSEKLNLKPDWNYWRIEHLAEAR